ncbi:hypothetical protein KIN20_030457 [Parelaphostrongylus tenuis]|uniref:Uncharacterized protein n=1 Tax=Parelaphostrongylus tenuis TaxID=148309 RepID=A0AAD5R479_PARTN|nr:hypothetical protein KIN20_030457 [Parelaphostrongylus tenuis]
MTDVRARVWGSAGMAWISQRPPPSHLRSGLVTSARSWTDVEERVRGGASRDDIREGQYGTMRRQRGGSLERE